MDGAACMDGVGIAVDVAATADGGGEVAGAADATAGGGAVPVGVTAGAQPTDAATTTAAWLRSGVFNEVMVAS